MIQWFAISPLATHSRENVATARKYTWKTQSTLSTNLSDLQDNNSNYSISEPPQSDAEYIDEKEVERKKIESHALAQLERAQVSFRSMLFAIRNANNLRRPPQSKQVAFSVRTNVSYQPQPSDHCPVPRLALPFGVKEYLHIKEV